MGKTETNKKINHFFLFHIDSKRFFVVWKSDEFIFNDDDCTIFRMRMECVVWLAKMVFLQHLYNENLLILHINQTHVHLCFLTYILCSASPTNNCKTDIHDICCLSIFTVSSLEPKNSLYSIASDEDKKSAQPLRSHHNGQSGAI